jgi:hypothetical protein
LFLIKLPMAEAWLRGVGEHKLELVFGEGHSISLDQQNRRIQLRGDDWDVRIESEGGRIELEGAEIDITSTGHAAAEEFVGTGSPGLTLVLSENQVVVDSVEVVIDGEEWEQVSALTEAAADAKVFVVSHNYQGNAFIQFGGGGFGASPPSGATIAIGYKHQGLLNIDAATLLTLNSKRRTAISSDEAIRGNAPLVSGFDRKE